MSAQPRGLGPESSPTSPTSPNEWSTLDNAPLLMEDVACDEDKKTEDSPKVEPQKSSSINEFKIAASHFLVSDIV
jgi:hypothetical protein